MSIFDIVESLTKAAVNVAITPVTLAADVITMGGTFTDKDQSYTGKNLKKLIENLEDAAE